MTRYGVIELSKCFWTSAKTTRGDHVRVTPHLLLKRAVRESWWDCIKIVNWKQAAGELSISWGCNHMMNFNRQQTRAIARATGEFPSWWDCMSLSIIIYRHKQEQLGNPQLASSPDFARWWDCEQLGNLQKKWLFWTARRRQENFDTFWRLKCNFLKVFIDSDIIISQKKSLRGKSFNYC